MEMVLRVFLEVGHREEAEPIARDLADVLRTVANLRSLKVREYWKITEYFEALLVFELSEDDAAGSLATAIAALGTGWWPDSTRSAIWNHGEGHTFRADKVRWAHIELLE
jgi:hypothetical protein